MVQFPCVKCQRNVTKASKALQCYMCNRWTHTRCCEVNDDLYDSLMKYNGCNLKFCCDACCPKLDKAEICDTDTTNGSADESSEDDSPNVTCIPNGNCENKDPSKGGKIAASTPKKRRTRKSKRRKTMASTKQDERDDAGTRDKPTKPVEPQVTADLAGSVMVNGMPPQTQQFGHANKPSNPRKAPREQCLIILNIPESSAELPQARVDYDIAALRTCLGSLFVAGEETIAATIKVKGAYRLGRRHEDVTQNPRPLKIILNSVEESQAIIRRAHRLKGQKVRILRDLSPEDRIKLKQALTELSERRAKGETNLIIRNFRVVKIRPKIRWFPLSLDAGLPVPGPLIQH